MGDTSVYPLDGKRAAGRTRRRRWTSIRTRTCAASTSASAARGTNPADVTSAPPRALTAIMGHMAITTGKVVEWKDIAGDLCVETERIEQQCRIDGRRHQSSSLHRHRRGSRRAGALLPPRVARHRPRRRSTRSRSRSGRSTSRCARARCSISTSRRSPRSVGIDAIEYVNQFFMDKATDAAYLAEMNARAKGEGVTQVLIMCDNEGTPRRPRCRQAPAGRGEPLQVGDRGQDARLPFHPRQCLQQRHARGAEQAGGRRPAQAVRRLPTRTGST